MKSPSKRQGTIRLRTPAKVTPWLHILDRREDGYHDVDLCLVPVSIYDDLEIRVGGEGTRQLRIRGGNGLSALDDNLVLRAAVAFEQETGSELALNIDLVKRIPWGAGLGGGSSDAAATLLALNRVTGAELPPESLFRMALQIGTDVPFFLDPRPSRAEGRGEILTAIERFPLFSAIVVKPPFSISTSDAYTRVVPRGSAVRVEPPADFDGLLEVLDNDFEEALAQMFPELEEIHARLAEVGAEGSALTGSGSAVFGVFRDSLARDRAVGPLRSLGRWEVHACEALPRHVHLADQERV
jgi:4-diphosphocytidyl-2-C-methyl-D-erythritol kinase